MFNRRGAPVMMVIALAALLGLGVTARSQLQQPPSQQQSPTPGRAGSLPTLDGAPPDDGSVTEKRMQIKQAERRNTDRQAQLVQDTDRLFDLAKELKDQVDKTNKNVLSVDVVKKADEIEKLAKSVHDKMKAN